MTLDEFVRSLPVDTRQLLKERFDLLLRHIALTKQFVHNIGAECRLTDMFWRDLVGAVVSVSVDADRLKPAIVEVCRNHTHSGGPIALPWPTLYGRAVPKEQFCKYLRKWGYMDTLPEARDFVSQLARCSLADCKTQLGSMHLGKYAMWATFDPANPADDPFLRLPADTEELSARLGLNPDESRRDLLLLVYSLPAGIVPNFPTIADSYAGEGWLLWFRPAGSDAECGWTLPWKPKAQPCPEVIHRPITGETLQRGVRILKGR